MEGLNISDLPEYLVFAAVLGGFMVYLVKLLHKQQQERDLENRDALAEQLELMRNFWNGQQDSTREVLKRVIDSVERMLARLEHHDEKTDLAIAAMFERTKDTPPEGLDIPTKPRKRPQ